jgi:hypothetical protein
MHTALGDACCCWRNGPGALAHDVPDDVMSAHLLEIAAELEARADVLERRNTPLPTAPTYRNVAGPSHIG